MSVERKRTRGEGGEESSDEVEAGEHLILYALGLSKLKEYGSTYASQWLTTRFVTLDADLRLAKEFL